MIYINNHNQYHNHYDNHYDKNNKEHNDIWHREDWLDDSEECFYKLDHNDYLLSNLMYSCARDKNIHLN